MNRKYFSDSLTSYDLIKSLGLLLLLLDVFGSHFFAGNQWFAVFGRGGYIISFFLVGYMKSRDLPKLLWIGALAIIASVFVFGGVLLPLNILVTVIICRLLLDKVARLTFRNWEITMYGTFAIAAMTACTFFLFEGGMAALLIAMSGYLSRHSSEINLSEKARQTFMGFSAVFYAFLQLLIYHSPDHTQSQAMVVMIGAVSILLYYFQPREVPEIEEKLPAFVTSALQFGGRYTLEIFIAVEISFKLAACLLGTAGYGWFHWAVIR